MKTNKNLSLADKIRNENLRKSLKELSQRKTRLEKELSELSGTAEPIDDYWFYFIFFLSALLIYILLDHQPGSLGSFYGYSGEDLLILIVIMGGLPLIFWGFLWILYAIPYIGFISCTIMFIIELITTRNRKRYLEISEELENIRLEKKRLKSKIKR